VTRCLVLVDLQNDYFSSGAYPLVGAEEAVKAARAVLDRFRTAGEPVIHVQHIWDSPDAPFMRPGTRGVEIHDLVAPVTGEPVEQKVYPNSFRETTLQARLEAAGAESLVVVGMMTSMCVDSTVRAAFDLGYDVTLVADACAAPDLEHGGRRVPGEDVHAAFVASLADGFAAVVTADALA
jgi:nicotinamidase-related amidase